MSTRIACTSAWEIQGDSSAPQAVAHRRCGGVDARRGLGKTGAMVGMVNCNPSRLAQLVVVAAAMWGILLMGAARGASAQGTAQNFADPIGLAELAGMLERSAIDAREEWGAIEAAHTEYLRQCQALRDGAIEQLLKAQREFYAGDQASRPTARQLQDWYEQLDSVRRRFMQLDSDLLGAVRQALPEGVGQRIGTIQAIRQRAHFSPDEYRGIVGPAATVDVLQVFRDVEAASASEERLRQECESTIGDYPIRQARALGALAIQVARARVSQAAVLEEDPLLDAAEVDEAQLRAHMDRMQAAMREAFAPVGAIERTLRENNRRAQRAISVVLARADPAWERRFREGVLAKAYPSIAAATQYEVDSVALRALRLKSLDEGQRSSIRQTFAQWRSQDDAIIEEMVAATDRRSDVESQNIGTFVPPTFGDHAETMARHERHRRGIADGAKALILGVVGPTAQELFSKIATSEESQFFLPESQIDLEAATARPLEGANGVDLVSATAQLDAPGRCLWRVRKMDDSWTARIAAALGANDAELAALKLLMVDYQSVWNQAIRPDADVMRAFCGLPTELPVAAHDQGGPPAPASEAEVQSWASRAAKLDKQRVELESRLFEDIKTVVADGSEAEVVNLLRCARRCGDRIPGLDSTFDNRTGGEENANVAQSATSVQLTPQECQRVASALAGQMALLEAASARLDATVRDLWRVKRINDLTIAMVERLNDSERWAAALKEMGAREAEVIDAGLIAARAKAQVQREAFAAAIGVLDDAPKRAVQSAFLRDAYFDAYGSNEPAAQALESACRIADLSETQRGQLSIARDEYQAQRDAAVGKMVLTMGRDAHAPAGAGDDQERSVATTLAQLDELEKYAFARDEARDKLLLRIRVILTAEQLRAAGIK